MTTNGQRLILRVNGPIVDAGGMRETRMYEVVEVGPRRLVGYVVGFSETAEVKDIKEIEGVIDAEFKAE